MNSNQTAPCCVAQQHTDLTDLSRLVLCTPGTRLCKEKSSTADRFWPCAFVRVLPSNLARERRDLILLSVPSSQSFVHIAAPWEAVDIELGKIKGNLAARAHLLVFSQTVEKRLRTSNQFLGKFMSADDQTTYFRYDIICNKLAIHAGLKAQTDFIHKD